MVSATPLNNRFGDILSQIKLFQSPRKSWIPGIPNLENFFNKLERPLKKLQRSDEEYAESVRTGSELIRDKVLKHIMVRRTRTEIKKYFNNDIEKQGLFFPEVASPNKIVYQFDNSLSHTFLSTLEILIGLFAYLIFYRKQQAPYHKL